MSWNFDISQAPKGELTIHETNRKDSSGLPVMAELYHHVRIIVAGNNNVVTLSKWLPDAERWEMFTKDVPPLAWQYWPEHPHANISPEAAHEVRVAQVEAGSHPSVPVSNPAPATISPARPA